MSTDAQLLPLRPARRRATAVARSRTAQYVLGVAVLAAGYYGAAKVGQTLRYTGSVSAIWPPAGLGIAALYLWGLRWWPGIFLGELIINGELLLHNSEFPIGSIVGQQSGNMAEIVVGAVLLRRIIGPRAALDRVDAVAGMLVAVGIATAISATVGTLSMLAGGVIETSAVPTFWRTWWLGDTSGALVVLPLLLVWGGDPVAAWRRVRTVEGALLLVAVVGLTVVAVTTDYPLTYMVFPALIWAALRFGPPGATLSSAIVAALTIGITAHQLGPFSKQEIDDRTLSTQLYIFVATLTALFLSAVVSERERSARELVAAKRDEERRALAERQRIARDLHDSVSQALFSTVLHTRTAQRALEQNGSGREGAVAEELRAIGELTRGAQNEMRALIFELAQEPLDGGLVAALERHGEQVGADGALAVRVEAPEHFVALAPGVEGQLFAIAREALVNVARHADVETAVVRVEAHEDLVVLEISDDGRGFDPAVTRPGHFGLASMRSRAAEIGGVLTLDSAPGRGTVVRVEVARANGSAADGR